MTTLRGQRPLAVLLTAIGAALVATVVLAASVPSGGALGAASDPASAGTGRQPAAGSDPPARITAVAAENQYGNVIAQVGGRYVSVSSLLTNPNTDPHTFEASPQVAREVASARLLIQNGLGYDSFMDSIESASPGQDRDVINVQRLLHLPDSTPNPHLWYDPGTMPKVADAIAVDLAAIDPAHAAYYRANAAAFTRSLGGWYSALAALKLGDPGTPVATTEPVALAGRKVRAFVYNVQVTDPLTQSLIALAKASGVPVVGVYETMPQPGFSYQSWMLAEAAALKSAITTRTSTEHL